MVFLRRRRSVVVALLGVAVLLLPLCSAIAQVLGVIAWVDPRAHVQPPGSARRDIKTADRYPVTVIETVLSTESAAAANVNVGPDNDRGVIQVGPKSKLVFKKWVIDAARGRIREAGWELQVGLLRAFFTPERVRRNPQDSEARPGEREIWIETPATEKIRLIGTAVQVEVAPDGTTVVWVIEGSAKVEFKGEEVTLPTGSWTVFDPNGGGPRPLDPESPAPPDDRGPFPPVYPEPPDLDPRDLRLDLPKEGPP